MTTFEPVCLCGDPESRHKLRRGGCRAVDCDCARYREDAKATEVARDAFLGGPAASLERSLAELESTDPAVGEAARRLDETAASIVAAASLPRAGRPTPHLDAVKAELADWMRAAGQARAERDLARAELASAGTELGQLRAERSKAYAANGQLLDELEQLRALSGFDPYPKEACGKRTGRASNRCLLPAGHPTDCDDEPPISRPGLVIATYDAWSCLTANGCGARYTRQSATADHACGPLTPVRVAITYRTEGAPTA